MSLQEIKGELAAMPQEEQDHLAAYLVQLRHQRDTALRPDSDSEEAWLRVAASSNAFAFLPDPAEDIYTTADGKPFHNAV